MRLFCSSWFSAEAGVGVPLVSRAEDIASDGTVAFGGHAAST